jgi:hypothetical protein
MAVLLYGTAIYNAPNPGSVLLTGGFSSFFVDCSDEYEYESELKSVSERAATVTCRDNKLPPITHRQQLPIASPFVNSPVIRQQRREENFIDEREDTSIAINGKKKHYGTDV